MLSQNPRSSAHVLVSLNLIAGGALHEMLVTAAALLAKSVTGCALLRSVVKRAVAKPRSSRIAPTSVFL